MTVQPVLMQRLYFAILSHYVAAPRICKDKLAQAACQRLSSPVPLLIHLNPEELP
jgi:hypothetical protein